jgi:hypothetical protein
MRKPEATPQLVILHPRAMNGPSGSLRPPLGSGFVRRPGGWCRADRSAPIWLGAAWSKIGVAVRTREIYYSANGDRWLLARDPGNGRVFVRHEPNLASGGQVADMDVGAFLIAAGNGPEKQELLRLIGTLVRGPDF